MYGHSNQRMEISKLTFAVDVEFPQIVRLVCSGSSCGRMAACWKSSRVTVILWDLQDSKSWIIDYAAIKLGWQSLPML
jgi:hypothetical protein